jgi:hypothetical protein
MSAKILQFAKKKRSLADDLDWQSLAHWLCENPQFLQGREFEFVDSMARWRRGPSARQLDWLQAISRRYQTPAGLSRPASHPTSSR